MATLLIKGGTVVSATGRTEADVLVDGEQVVALLAPGSQLLGTDVGAGVDQVIDATGKYVIPGGVDAHTHMELPFGGTFASDTFETGTRAAAWGGTTSIIDFAVQPTASASRTVSPLGTARPKAIARSTTASTRSSVGQRCLASRPWTGSSTRA
jgi:dihydroorotase-like cyclic amidohydrolase